MDNAGTILVADPGNNRVQTFTLSRPSPRCLRSSAGNTPGISLMTGSLRTAMATAPAHATSLRKSRTISCSQPA